MQDDLRSGRSSTSGTEKNIAIGETLLKEGRRLSIRELSAKLSLGVEVVGKCLKNT